MTTLNAALNFGFASTEGARIAQAERSAQEAIAARLSEAAAATPFAAGTIVTARYQYRVGVDGNLLPIETQITTTPSRDGGRVEGDRRTNRQLQRDDRRPSIADLLRPRPSLSPSDELAVFAAIDGRGQGAEDIAQQQGLLTNPSSTLAAEVSDETGQPVEAEVLTFRPRGRDARQQQAQVAVASLYARNNDVVYNVSPISQLAA